MIERRGNLWTFRAHWRIITTNGAVKSNGDAVMGVGCAKEAADRYIMLPRELGARLSRCGNLVFAFPEYQLLTFPVKDHWRTKASLKLIRESTRMLRTFLNPSNRYVMPRAGCGAGGLSWEEVKPILATLPDNVFVIHFAEDE